MNLLGTDHICAGRPSKVKNSRFGCKVPVYALEDYRLVGY